MCSIIGSYNVNEVKMLADLNAYRGQHSHSICVVDDNEVKFLHRGFGALDKAKLDDLPQGYIICHQQAPTTDAKDEKSIHPANNKGALLWHNGIIKAKQVKAWKSEWNIDEAWDTKWLLKFLVQGHYNFNFLSDVDGTFACVYYHPHSGITMFRNANSPLFLKGSTISSTKFDGSVSVDAGKVYQLQSDQKWYIIDKTFETKEQFYWSPA